MHLADHGLPTLGVLQDHAEDFMALLRADRLVVLDQRVLFEDARDLDLELRLRNIHAPVLRSACVADAGQHIGDRVGHRHDKGPWLPARLANAGDETVQGQLAEADAAEAELAQKRARAAAALTAIVLSHRELWRPLGLLDHRFTCHQYSLSMKTSVISGQTLGARLPSAGALLRAERETELLQQSERPVVATSRGDERDIHPVHLIDHVVIDLRK